ncbi:MAG: DUF169 domain-containing protein [Dehalococcoidia bacterium]
MRPLQTDLSIFKKFKFEKPPVGIKFLLFKPERMKQLDKTLAICEMLKEAQQSKTPFYFTKENENCFGKIILGMEDVPPFAEGGQVGPMFGVYQEPRANSKIYQYAPKIKSGVFNYAAFSPLDKLTFEPDLLILTATTSQAEIVLRAMSYSNGEIWETKFTPVLECAWVFTYPYLSGKVNYTTTGLGFGMKAKEIWPDGLMLISIPFNWIPTITQNLKEMEWVLPSYTEGREKFIKREQRYIDELSRKSQNP